MKEFNSRATIMVPIILGVVISYACSSCGTKNETSAEQELMSPSQKVVLDNRPVVAALGDSLTAGQGVESDWNYPSLLQRKIDENGYAYRVVNFGVSGDTSGQGLNRLQAILKTRPAIVIVELGANDGLRGIPASVTRDNLSAIVAMLQAEGTKVVLAGMQVPPNYGPQYAADFSGVYRDVAKKYRVALIPFFLEDVGGNASLNLDDGIHPNAEGYKVVTENVWRTLKPML